MGAAWEQHSMCELAFKLLYLVFTCWCYDVYHARLCEFCKVLLVKSVFKMAGRPNVWSYRAVQIDSFIGDIWSSHGSRWLWVSQCHMIRRRVIWQIDTGVHEDFVLNSSCTKLLFLSSSDIIVLLQQRYSCVGYWCVYVKSEFTYVICYQGVRYWSHDMKYEITCRVDLCACYWLVFLHGCTWNGTVCA